LTSLQRLGGGLFPVPAEISFLRRGFHARRQLGFFLLLAKIASKAGVSP